MKFLRIKREWNRFSSFISSTLSDHAPCQPFDAHLRRKVISSERMLLHQTCLSIFIRWPNSDGFWVTDILFTRSLCSFFLIRLLGWLFLVKDFGLACFLCRLWLLDLLIKSIDPSYYYWTWTKRWQFSTKGYYPWPFLQVTYSSCVLIADNFVPNAYSNSNIEPPKLPDLNGSIVNQVFLVYVGFKMGKMYTARTSVAAKEIVVTWTCNF